MKIGTDAMLLGSWADTTNATQILDVGTGCGVIAIMLAQRNQKAQIYGIDIDNDSINEAKENVENCPWNQRIKVTHSDFQNYNSSARYDLIIANPPFFTSGTLPPSEHRKKARHTQSLSFTDFIDNTSRLLSDSGKVALVLPIKESRLFINKAVDSGFHLNRQLIFKPKADANPERILFEMSKFRSRIIEEEMVHYTKAGKWTKEYIKLTNDFHLIT